MMPDFECIWNALGRGESCRDVEHGSTFHEVTVLFLTVLVNTVINFNLGEAVVRFYSLHSICLLISPPSDLSFFFKNVIAFLIGVTTLVVDDTIPITSAF